VSRVALIPDQHRSNEKGRSPYGESARTTAWLVVLEGEGALPVSRLERASLRGIALVFDTLQLVGPEQL
jgi:hypothetical protein